MAGSICSPTGSGLVASSPLAWTAAAGHPRSELVVLRCALDFAGLLVASPPWLLATGRTWLDVCSAVPWLGWYSRAQEQRPNEVMDIAKRMSRLRGTSSVTPLCLICPLDTNQSELHFFHEDSEFKFSTCWYEQFVFLLVQLITKDA